MNSRNGLRMGDILATRGQRAAYALLAVVFFVLGALAVFTQVAGFAIAAIGVWLVLAVLVAHWFLSNRTRRDRS